MKTIFILWIYFRVQFCISTTLSRMIGQWVWYLPLFIFASADKKYLRVILNFRINSFASEWNNILWHLVSYTEPCNRNLLVNLLQKQNRLFHILCLLLNDLITKNKKKDKITLWKSLPFFSQYSRRAIQSRGFVNGVVKWTNTVEVRRADSEPL